MSVREVAGSGVDEMGVLWGWEEGGGSLFGGWGSAAAEPSEMMPFGWAMV